MQDSVDKQLITISGTRVRQVFGGSPRKLHNHSLPKGYPAITFGNRGIVDFFGNIVFSYGFFVILFSVIYIRRLFCSRIPTTSSPGRFSLALGAPPKPGKSALGTRLGYPTTVFTSSALKTLFWLSRVLLDLQICILRGAAKYVSVRSSWEILSVFEISRASILFSPKFQIQLSVLHKK